MDWSVVPVQKSLGYYHASAIHSQSENEHTEV